MDLGFRMDMTLQSLERQAIWRWRWSQFSAAVYAAINLGLVRPADVCRPSWARPSEQSYSTWLPHHEVASAGLKMMP